MRQIIFTLFLFSFAGGYGQKLLNQSDIEEKKFGMESLFSLYEDKSPLNGAYKISQGNGEYYEASFSDGKLDGIAKYYDRNGKIMAERSYKNGQLTGVSREYHPNGKVKKEIELTAGIFTGFYREYTRSGMLWREYFYKNDQMEGSFREFSDGKVVKDFHYKADKPDGEWKEYDEDGKPIEIEHYKMGKKMANSGICATMTAAVE